MLLIKIVLILLFLAVIYQNSKINSLEDDINEIEKELVDEVEYLDVLSFITNKRKVSTIKGLQEELKKKSDEIDQLNKLRKELEKYLGITYVKTESKTEGYEKINLIACSGSGVTYSNCGSYTDVSYEKPKKVAKKSKKK